jgi:hypothetical protein
MAALDFPASPTVNQQYPSPAVTGVPVYTWDGEKWTTKGGAIGSTGASDAVPALNTGNGSAGVSTLWARGDHTHPLNAPAHWKYSGAAGAGFWLDSFDTADRFFVGTDLGSDNWRVFAAGYGANAITVNGLTGLVTIPNLSASSIAATTPPVGDNDTSIATTAFVKNVVALGAAADFNAITLPGTYYTIDTSSTNTPGGAYNWIIQVWPYPDTNYIYQFATPVTVGGPPYYRNRVGGVWGAWKFLLDYSMWATTAEFLNNTASKILTTDKVWAAAAQSVLTDGATINTDMATGINFACVIGAANRTLANPTNTTKTQSGVFLFYNGISGGGVMINSWGSKFKFPGGVKPSPSTANGSYDIMSYYMHADGNLYCTYNNGFA